MEFILILKDKEDIIKVEYNDKIESVLKKLLKKTKASAIHRELGIVKFTDNDTILNKREIDNAINRLKKYKKIK